MTRKFLTSLCLVLAGYGIGRFSAPGPLSPAQPAIPARGTAAAPHPWPDPRPQDTAAREPDAGPAAGEDDPRARWAEISGQAPGAARERALAGYLRLLAATDPQGALALAGQEPNFRVRKALVVESLKGWAERDPAASLAWAANNLFESNRHDAIEAVIEAGMARPDAAVAAVGAVCATSDGATAADYGAMLVSALARHGDFETALGFAASSSPEAGRDHLVATALYSWAQYDPAAASLAISRFTDPATRNEALHGLILGWGSNDPASLLKYAGTLPSGQVRAQAFGEALEQWVANDPAAASAWLEARDPDPELDRGVVKLATTPFLVARDVHAALDWARGVSDPEQRSMAIVDIIRQWSAKEPAAALAYLDAVPDLAPTYKQQLLDYLAASSAPRSPDR